MGKNKIVFFILQREILLTISRKNVFINFQNPRDYAHTISIKWYTSEYRFLFTPMLLPFFLFGLKLIIIIIMMISSKRNHTMDISITRCCAAVKRYTFSFLGVLEEIMSQLPFPLSVRLCVSVCECVFYVTPDNFVQPTSSCPTARFSGSFCVYSLEVGNFKNTD